MKRCIVCGNIGNDDSTICSVCGNPFIETDDNPERNASGESLEKMEEQFREMWAKVQGADFTAAQETAEEPEPTEEPELSVFSEEPVAQESEQAAGKSEVTDAKQESEMTSGVFGEAAVQKERAVQEAMNAEAQKESAVQETMNTEAPKEPVGQKPVDVEALMRAAAEKTAGEEAGIMETAGEKSVGEKAGTMETAGGKSVGEEAGTMETAGEETAETGRSDGQRTPRPQTRRTKPGPQIYGQDSMAEYSGAQGVIRRDVQGGHAAASRTGSGNSAASGRSASRPPRRPAAAPIERNMSVQNVEAEAPGTVPAGAPDAPGNPAKQVSGTQRMSAQPYPQPPQGGQNYGQQGGGKHQGAARRIMDAAQDALSSPLLIVIALFQTVYFVSAVAAIFLRQLNYGQTAKLLTLLPLPSQISGYTTMLQAALAQLDSGALALNLLIRVPDLLFCIALWVLCITVRSAGEKMSGSGFSLMRIAVILNMIASCLAFLLVLVVCVIFVIAAWNTGTTSLITLAVATLVVAIIATMAVIMYFFCYLSTIKAIRKNAVSGERYGSVSTYVAVVKMVLSLTAIISILSGIVNLEITGITTGVGKLAWMILFGIWILRYKNTLSEYEER